MSSQEAYIKELISTFENWQYTEYTSEHAKLD